MVKAITLILAVLSLVGCDRVDQNLNNEAHKLNQTLNQITQIRKKIIAHTEINAELNSQIKDISDLIDIARATLNLNKQFIENKEAKKTIVISELANEINKTFFNMPFLILKYAKANDEKLEEELKMCWERFEERIELLNNVLSLPEYAGLIFKDGKARKILTELKINSSNTLKTQTQEEVSEEVREGMREALSKISQLDMKNVEDIESLKGMLSEEFLLNIVRTQDTNNYKDIKIKFGKSSISLTDFLYPLICFDNGKLVFGKKSGLFENFNFDEKLESTKQFLCLIQRFQIQFDRDIDCISSYYKNESNNTTSEIDKNFVSNAFARFEASTFNYKFFNDYIERIKETYPDFNLVENVGSTKELLIESFRKSEWKELASLGVENSNYFKKDDLTNEIQEEIKRDVTLRYSEKQITEEELSLTLTRLENDVSGILKNSDMVETSNFMLAMAQRRMIEQAKQRVTASGEDWAVVGPSKIEMAKESVLDQIYGMSTKDAVKILNQIAYPN
jgi:hypothetical protein